MATTAWAPQWAKCKLLAIRRQRSPPQKQLGLGVLPPVPPPACLPAHLPAPPSLRALQPAPGRPGPIWAMVPGGVDHRSLARLFVRHSGSGLCNLNSLGGGLESPGGGSERGSDWAEFWSSVKGRRHNVDRSAISVCSHVPTSASASNDVFAGGERVL